MMVARSDWRGTKSNTLRAADGSATKKAGSRGAALSPHAVSFARFAAQLARGSGVLKSLGTGAGFIFILDQAIPRQAGSLGHCTVDPPSCCAASPLPPCPQSSNRGWHCRSMVLISSTISPMRAGFRQFADAAALQGGISHLMSLS
jgi:hypothetical protein